MPPRTIDEAQEDQIIKLLEIQQKKRLQQDPMRELDEALMDRTTASMNRRQKMTSMHTNLVEQDDVDFTPDIIDINCQTIHRLKVKSRNECESDPPEESMESEASAAVFDDNS